MSLHDKSEALATYCATPTLYLCVTPTRAPLALPPTRAARLPVSQPGCVWRIPLFVDGSETRQSLFHVGFKSRLSLSDFTERCVGRSSPRGWRGAPLALSPSFFCCSELICSPVQATANHLPPSDLLTLSRLLSILFVTLPSCSWLSIMETILWNDL